MREFFMVLLILLPVAGLLVLNYFISREFSLIADEKGYDGHRYFHFCFWLGLIGILMVVALPDRGGQAAKVTPAAARDASQVPVAFSNDRKPHMPPIKTLTSRISNHYTGTVPNPWRCSCGTINPASRGSCDTCGAPKGALTQEARQPGQTTIAPVPSDWQCACGQENHKTHRCSKCGSWLCPSCSAVNPPAKGSCEACGAAKPR